LAINYDDICKNVFSEKEFIENSLLGIGVIQDGRIIYANNTILNLFGYSFDEIQEKNFWMKVIHPDDLDIITTKIETKLKEKKYMTTRYKCRINTNSGKFKWIEVFSKFFYHNNTTAILFTVIEIQKPVLFFEIAAVELEKVRVIESLLQRFNIPYRVLKQ